MVVTMIVVAVMAMVAVAFMQGAGTDRSSSRSFVAHYQARLAADAGAQCAVWSVRRTLCFGGNPTNTNSAFGYHDAVTVWQNIGGAATNEATVLYVRAKSGNNSNQGARPGEFGPNIQILARPLVSGGQFVPLSSIGTNMPFNPNDTNLMREMVNLNATNALNPDPWIGYRSAPVAGAPVTAARWVYISRDGGPTNTTNPPIARYAYWVEDESFKANLNVLTNGVRGTNTGTSPQQATIDGAIGASANLRALTNRTAAMLQDRATLGAGGFTDRGSAAIALGLQGVTNAAEFRFLTTVNSAGLDLSRGGFKRFNINSVTNGVTGPTPGQPGVPTDVANIRTSLSRIIAAITNSNSVPNFGQRFYRLAADSGGINNNSAVTATHANIYLQKIAANILDYVDSDDQPTVINNDASFTLRTGKPEFGIEPLGEGTEGTNSIAAMGVENTPRLQEYAIHGRIRELNPIGYNSSRPPEDPVASYRISIDHYFEFWNPGTRDITINNAFLKIYDQPRFGDNITGPLANEGRPFEIPVNGITFPAGRVTVLTTAPQNELNEALVIVANRTNVVHLDTDAANRIFEGQTRDTSVGTAFGGNGFNTYFKVSLKPRSTTVTDYESAVLLGNNLGVLESFVGLPIVRATATGTVPSIHFVASSAAAAAVVGDTPAVLSLGNQYYTVAGSLAGNSTAAAGLLSAVSGDPRSLNEQLEIKLYDANGSNQQTRFLSANLNNNSVPSDSTVGGPNANYVQPTNWVDFSSVSTGANNAPLFVRNGSLQSIGELGHLTDPARVPGTSGTLNNVTYSRGGGRTLRIGQSEHPRWYDGNQTNASRTWTSWRLADVFTTTGAVSIPGLINPNGALRDGGAALRAALHGLTYLPSPEGVPGLAGLQLTGPRLDAIVNSNRAFLTNASAAGLPAGAVNAFWERGEFSQLPVFNSGTIPTSMSNKFDRGREELVRRSIEMITTRGSIFTVYVIGQALQVASQTTNVLGSARLKQTFEISPQYATADAFDDSFNPTQPNKVSSRFSAPTNYTYRLISSGYD